MKEAEGGDDVEKAGEECRLAERVVGKRGRPRKKATAWWNDEVREVVQYKKELYRKALNVKTDEAWEKYKKANKEAKGW